MKYGFLAIWEDFEMGRRRYKPEEIVAKLRQVDVLTSQDHSVAEAVRSIGVTEVTYSRCLKWLLCIVAMADPALANDSTAELKTGGLVLLKSTNIEMKSEDLFISPGLIKIKYVFQNNSGADVATVVPFPMPRIKMNPLGETIMIPNEEANNFLDFTTTVEGQPISARVELRAYLNHCDVTSILKEVGIPLSPNLEKTEKALARLANSKKRELRERKLITDGVGGAGQPVLDPDWSLATTYYFDVLFPAGKKVEINHTYRPSVGTSNVTRLGDPTASDVKDEIKNYCVSDPMLDQIKSTRKAWHLGSRPIKLLA